jgi:chaperonin GroES
MIKPLNDRIIVKKIPTETVTTGGIVLPGAAAEKPSVGEVIAAGPGKELPDGSTREMHVAVGDKVLFLKTAGVDIKLDEGVFTQMLEDEVLAILG